MRHGQRPWPATRELRGAAIWAAAIALVAAAYAVAAPVIDDWRSGLRAMSPDCRVSGVVDGDTVDLVCPGAGLVRARIVGYDSPEFYSPRCESERAAAERARQVLGDWVHQATRTEVAFLGHDRYRRALVDMRLSGKRVAQGMVGSGNGRRYFGSWRGGWC